MKLSHAARGQIYGSIHIGNGAAFHSCYPIIGAYPDVAFLVLGEVIHRGVIESIGNCILGDPALVINQQAISCTQQHPPLPVLDNGTNRLIEHPVIRGGTEEFLPIEEADTLRGSKPQQAVPVLENTNYITGLQAVKGTIILELIAVIPDYLIGSSIP